MRKGKHHDWRTDEGLELLSSWARQGWTDEEMAGRMGIASSTFYEWKRRFPEISEALKRNKEVADAQVEQALFKRAIGMDVETVTEDYEEGVLVRTRRVTKTLAPDVTAQIFWLKNRQPERWRDRPPADDGEALDKLDEVLDRIGGAF